MNRHPKYLVKSLIERKHNGLLRKLNYNFPGIDFCSNDYLGFSKKGLLTEKLNGLDPGELYGSTGSRLISGNSQVIEEAEKQIALFHHAEKALIFNSGYDANVGILSSVPQKMDLILFDELVHASVYDGIRLSHATHYKFKHNDVEALKDLIHRHQKSFENIFIVVESVYSMDGDTAPLQEMVELADTPEENIFLIVDEAHAIGVFGKQGRGLCNALGIEQKCFARIYTYGKAMGCHGAAIVGSEVLHDYLVNFARSFIYTTALPAHSIQAILMAYRLLIETDQKDHLQNNIAYFCSKTNSIKNCMNHQSAICSYLAGSNEAVDRLEAELAAKGIHAKAIKSPTVKAGSERVRFCIHSFNTKQEMDLLAELLTHFKK